MEEWSKLQVCHWFGFSTQGISAAEICQLAKFYDNEVESVECVKRTRQVGTEDCERSGRCTGASTPGKEICLENAVFEK